MVVARVSVLIEILMVVVIVVVLWEVALAVVVVVVVVVALWVIAILCNSGGSGCDGGGWNIGDTGSGEWWTQDHTHTDQWRRPWEMKEVCK